MITSKYTLHLKKHDYRHNHSSTSLKICQKIEHMLKRLIGKRLTMRIKT